MIADIADALLPVFLVMALGFFAGKRRILDSRSDREGMASAGER